VKTTVISRSAVVVAGQSRRLIQVNDKSVEHAKLQVSQLHRETAGGALSTKPFSAFNRVAHGPDSQPHACDV